MAQETDTIGRWTVLKRGPDWWLCRCACGNIKPVRANSLRRGDSKSCGCGRFATPATFPDEEFEETFWDRMDQRDGDACWPWMGSDNGRGYGVVFIPRRFPETGHNYTHRVSFRLAVGPIPVGLYVCHHCDNPSCCNPDHLFLGTQADNIADCKRKGRHSPPPVHEHPPKQVLNADQVREIRSAARAVTNVTLADQYGVSPATISRIRLGHGWKVV